jgi:mannose-6-phosphate isomerase-like protein (cupin superfamily)
MPTDPPPAVDLADASTVVAPDGAMVRVLLAGTRGSMARFELEPGQTSKAVRHRTVEELWHVLAGHGEMWRRIDGTERIDALEPGRSLLIPPGTSFQFRAVGDELLIVLGTTMPAWPGPDEADLVEGCPGWTPTP